MKSKITDFLLSILVIVGLGLITYPTIANAWNSFHQTKVVVNYTETVQKTDTKILEEEMEKAQIFNEELKADNNRWHLSDSRLEEYNALLSLDGSDVMGYLSIEKIDQLLPIYHGTRPEVLQVGVGHLEGSSLPVGGESTHAVLSGHRGLSSAKLLTRLDEMETGDVFYLNVLGEELYYEVDQILTVLPDEMDALQIEEGQDYCTLVTCTPYGINTHRLLVRGHRIDAPEEAVEESPVKVDLTIFYIGAAAILVLLLLAAGLYWRKKKKRKKGS